MYDLYFSNFGKPPGPNDLYAKIQPQGILGSGDEDFESFFTIYGHGGHLGQWTATILVIFRSPRPKEAPY